MYPVAIHEFGINMVCNKYLRWNRIVHFITELSVANLAGTSANHHRAAATMHMASNPIAMPPSIIGLFPWLLLYWAHSLAPKMRHVRDLRNGDCSDIGF